MSANDMRKLIQGMERELKYVVKCEYIMKKLDMMSDINKRYRNTIYTLYYIDVLTVQQFVFLRNRIKRIRRKYYDMV